MMISFKFLTNCIEFEDDKFPVLVIENKKLFRKAICSFENNFEEEYFTFSKHFEPVDFKKIGVFISSPINVDIESKKLIGKITSYIENVANTEYEIQLTKATQELIKLADLLCAFCDFDCEYNYDISAAEIIKLMQFKIGRAETSPEELLITYIKLVSKYMKTDLFIVPNLHLFFDENELALIYQTLEVNHINLLSLECLVPHQKLDCEKIYIVDEDLCEIDRGGI